MKKTELKQIIREVILENDEKEIVTPISDKEIDNIESVYSGKPGCMCGCRGKYKYASKYQDLASKRRGYKVDNDEVSDLSIKLIVKKINELLKSGDYVKAERTDKGVFVDTGNRYYLARLIKTS